MRSPAFIGISEGATTAFMAKIYDLPMQPIAARAGFVAEPWSLTTRLAQTLDKLADLIGAVQKIAEMAHLPAAFP